MKKCIAINVVLKMKKLLGSAVRVEYNSKQILSQAIHTRKSFELIAEEIN